MFTTPTEAAAGPYNAHLRTRRVWFCSYVSTACEISERTKQTYETNEVDFDETYF